MPEFLQNVENENHLKDSGEHIVTDTYKPKEFLDFAKLIWPVWSVLPKQAQNKDNFRNPDANQITATIIKQIEKKFQNKTKALKNTLKINYHIGGLCLKQSWIFIQTIL